MPSRFRRITAGTLIFFLFAGTVVPELSLAGTLSVMLEKQLADDGYLILQTRHKGLEIRVDQRLIGYTSDSVIVLSAGTHRVVVRHPNRSNWLDEDWFADIEVSEGDTLRLTVIFKKSYSINSKPYGASVFLEQEYIGETPIYVKLYEHEIKNVRLVKQGFEEKKIVIGNSDQQFFDVALQPDKAALDLSLQKVERDLRSHSKTKLYLYSTIGLAAVSGALALYFRNRANDRFERYRGTGNPELIDRFFNDAKKYDRYAAVSFGVFQVSFIVSFYLLLKQANRKKQRFH